MENENVRTESDSKTIIQNPSDSTKFENIKSYQECSEKQSSLSVRSKKSSNILAAFVRRTKAKRNIKSIQNSTQNLNFIRSNSSLGIHTEEEEIERELGNKNYELDEIATFKSVGDSEFDKCIHSADSDHSVPSTLRRKRQFFRRLLRKHSSYKSTNKSEIHNDSTIMNNLGQQNEDDTSVDKIERQKITQINITHNVPTSCVNFGNIALTQTLDTALQEIQDLANRLQDSESHFIRILTAFIKDSTLQKELVDILFQHSKLQWETERRTASLSNDIWLQQINVGRAQEQALQDTLTSLVKQNRHLQIENEILFRKHEKIARKLKNLSSTSSKHKGMDCDIQIEYILKHNEELQYKLEAYHREVQHLEEELHVQLNQNNIVEQRLRHSSSHVQNLKAMSARSKMGYELEIVTLQKDLQRNERIIKESNEARILLQDDFENIKRQLKSLPLAINWGKYTCKGNDLVDTINLSRSFLNEFGKEIISLCSKINLKCEDIEALKYTNSKLTESLQKSSTECVDPETPLVAEKSTSDTVCNNLKTDVKVLQEKLEKLKLKHELEKSSLINTVSEYEKLESKIVEKNNLLEQSKSFISNITTENLALRGQIDGLNRLLTEMGAGDMVKELSLSQDQLYFYKTQYYQLANEKQILLEKQAFLENEHTEILHREETNCRLFQKQMSDLENNQKETQLLRQQYDQEHQTVLSLQAERMKYLEEKGMLRTIFGHMKAELSRIQKLEGTVMDISKEANKLAIVAEYNQKLGSKLKNELLEKDKTIFELKSSVEKLNDIQIQHTKDKLSLCYELSEICQIRDHLSDILSVEVQKNYDLDDSKKEVVETAMSQIKKYEELQRNDRSALKSVLKDLKMVAAIKNTLQKENETLKEEIVKMKMLETEYVKKNDSLVFSKNEQELRLKDLKTLNNADKELVKKLEGKLANETAKYNNDLCQLKKLIIQLRKEKEELDNSVKYLQNNTQKLHSDLNDVRKTEKEIHGELKKSLLEKQQVELEMNQIRKNLEDANAEKEKLVSEISHLNTLCEKMLDSLEANMKSSIEKEELFKQEIENCKTLLVNLNRDNDNLKTIIKEKEIKITQLDKECSNLKHKEQQYYDMAKKKEFLDLEIVELKNKNMRLETEIQESQNEYNVLKMHFEQCQQALIVLQNQLKVIVEQKENNCYFYQQKLEESNRKKQDIEENYTMDNNNLKLQLNDLSERLENERCSYTTLAQIHKEISAKFIKSIKDIVDEKNAKQEAIKKLKIYEENLQTLSSEKADLQQQVTMLLDGMNESKNRINTLNQDKESLQNTLEQLHKRYNEILKKCLSLENQLLGTEIHLDNSENENMKQEILQFQSECQENQNLITNLRADISNLEHQMTAYEFEKSEITLKLHEIQRKFETEQNLCQQMKCTHRLVLATVLQMKDDGKIDSNVCNDLIHMVQSNTNCLSCEDY